MKLFVLFAVLACHGLAQKIQFANMSFEHPLVVGELWRISWTTGNGLPIDLRIGNTTWGFPIFTEFPVLPNSFDWTIPAPAGFVTGEYQLGINQDSADGSDSESMTWSPRFIVNVPMGSPTTFATPVTTLPPAVITDAVPVFPIAAAGTGAVSTVTLTYEFWDHECGCTKTQTAASPLNTGMAATTYTWYEDECACTKSAIVPVSTMGATWSNYTAPLNPPVPTNTTATPVGPAGTAAKTIGTRPFNGGSVQAGSSMLGLVALIAVAVFT